MDRVLKRYEFITKDSKLIIHKSSLPKAIRKFINLGENIDLVKKVTVNNKYVPYLYLFRVMEHEKKKLSR